MSTLKINIISVYFPFLPFIVPCTRISPVLKASTMAFFWNGKIVYEGKKYDFKFLLFKEVRKYISLFIVLTLLSRHGIRRTIGGHLTFLIVKQKSTSWPQYLIWRAFTFMSNWWNVVDATPIGLWRRLYSSNNIIFRIKPKQFFELRFWIIRESIKAIFR